MLMNEHYCCVANFILKRSPTLERALRKKIVTRLDTRKSMSVVLVTIGVCCLIEKFIIILYIHRKVHAI